MTIPRFLVATIVGLIWLVLPAHGQDQRFFEDATLRAVQFIDQKEGWAVGDEGVIWHTIDGGKSWERQSTGTNASLRSISFVTPFVGWIAGREELPNQSGSVGVLLYTKDGGEKWQRVMPNTLPGLNRIRFVTAKIGYLMGDGNERVPSGLLRTDDGGRSWQPVVANRQTSWLDGDFVDGNTGALAGTWSRLAKLREGTTLTAADVDSLGARSVRGIRLQKGQAFAVGDGGLVLSSRTNGGGWAYVDLKMPREALANLDFQTIDAIEDTIWIAGRPGSLIFRSTDAGKTWQTHATGQTLPIHSIYFVNPRQGWAVGALGQILASDDGGKSWRLQKRGGRRTPVLALHSRSESALLETLAHIGREEGYLTSSVQVNASDATSESVQRASYPMRYSTATRLAGAATGETLWQFSLPEHLHSASAQDLMQHWNKTHGGDAAQQLLQQLVLAIRMWRPDVIVTEPSTEDVGRGNSILIQEASKKAFELAGNPLAFPEQIKLLGLEAWTPSRLYFATTKVGQADVTINSRDPSPRLQSTAKDVATNAGALLLDDSISFPNQRHFQMIIASKKEDRGGATLLSGLEGNADYGGRRKLNPLGEKDLSVVKAVRERIQIQTILEMPTNSLVQPTQILSRINPLLEKLPPGQGALAAYAIGKQYVDNGQWLMAQETFQLMTKRFPAHPLTAEAYKWLIQHNTSSEVRRRYELGQFVMKGETQFEMPRMPSSDELKKALKESNKRSPLDGPKSNGNDEPNKLPKGFDPEKLKALFPGGKAHTNVQGTYLSNPADRLQWAKDSLDYAERIAQFGPVFFDDPIVGFCLQSARRQLGQFDKAQDWFKTYKETHRVSPWQQAAAAEHWLLHQQGLPNRPTMICRKTATKPYLDGKFDDACWEGVRGTLLHNSVGESQKTHQTEVRFAYDEEFFYVALRCTHPEEFHVPAAKERPRDADLRGFDRVSIMLDLDRDYSTYFHLQVDQRGCVAEDCWGDKRWNPKWFVAVRSSKNSWNIEGAIPLQQLTGSRVSLGTTWACNVVRTLPGRGVQAFSLPANVTPRPEGMGLLTFQEGDTIRPAVKISSPQQK